MSPQLFYLFFKTSYLHCSTHHFLFGAQHTQFAEAHMERGALVGAILLADHHYIDAAWERGLVNALIQLLHGHQHLTCQLPHIIHGARLKKRNRKQNTFNHKTTNAAKQELFFIFVNLFQYCICTWQMWQNHPFTHVESESLISLWLSAFLKLLSADLQMA